MSSIKNINSVDNTEFAERLRRAVSAKGLNQTSFAEALGVKQGHVSAWFLGTSRPSKLTLSLLAMLLGVSRDWLDDGSGAMEKKSTYKFVVRETPSHFGLTKDDINILSEVKRLLPHADDTAKQLLRDVIRSLKKMAGLN